MNNYLKVFSVLILSMNFPFMSLADGNCRTRNDCNLTGWKYKARARVNKFGLPSRDVDKGCPGGYYFAYVDNGCAWQNAENSYGTHAENGSVYKNTSICARGNSSSELYYDYFLDNRKDNSFFEHGKYSTSRVQFQNKKVTLDSINIQLQAKGEDLYSSFEVMMWLPQDEHDTIQSVEKSFLYGKIQLMNGKVKGEGIFEDVPLSVRKDAEGIYTVTLNNFKAIGKLPEGITNQNSTIEVYTSSDGGIDEKSAIEHALDNNSFEVKTYPNPTREIVNISLDETKSHERYSLTLYDRNGKVISIIENNISAKNLNNYQINLKEKTNNKGIYFLFIQSIDGKQKRLSKIVYQ